MLARRGTQLPLARKHGWGGKRPGAGRKRKDGRQVPAGVPHLRRARLDARHPVGVTLKVCREIWSLRRGRCARAIERALEASRVRVDFRVVHFSILSNHLHLIVEADGRTALSRGIQALEIRLARRLNRVMSRKGRVFADRFHAHVLRTPTEVARARRYVLQNFQIHRLRAGERGAPGLDPLSSAALPACATPPATWLLRIGWRRGRVRLLAPTAVAFRDGDPGTDTASPAMSIWNTLSSSE